MRKEVMYAAPSKKWSERSEGLKRLGLKRAADRAKTGKARMALIGRPRRKVMSKEELEVARKKRVAEAKLTPGQLETRKIERNERARARKREYMASRRSFRKTMPELAELDRLRYNESMRKYANKRRAADPVFAEKCREWNRQSANKRRAAAQAASAIEVDETEEG